MGNGFIALSNDGPTLSSSAPPVVTLGLSDIDTTGVLSDTLQVPSGTTTLIRPDGHGRSTTKVGMTAAGSDSIAVLPTGTAVKDQKKLSRSPSTSLEPLPSSVTVSPTRTVWSGPASATGGAFGGSAGGAERSPR